MTQSLRTRYNDLLVYVEEGRRQQVHDLLDWLEHSSDFFTAPASSRVRYHMCQDGGLALHCLNVVQILFQLIDLHFGPQKLSGLTRGSEPTPSMDFARLKSSAVIVAIAHDLNKVKFWGQACYVPNMLKTGRSEAEPYKKTKRVQTGGYDQLLITSRFVSLKPDEAQAIRYAEGKYDYSYREIEGSEEALTILLHHADMQAAFITEAVEPWTREHIGADAYFVKRVDIALQAPVADGF